MSGNATVVLVVLLTALTRIACVAGACHLVVHDHPVMAAWTLVLAFVCGYSISDNNKGKK